METVSSLKTGFVSLSDGNLLIKAALRLIDNGDERAPSSQVERCQQELWPIQGKHHAGTAGGEDAPDIAPWAAKGWRV